jgi:hypothetical protein|tara:strand:+ start:105 stop:305 length:201 start_codon:yes stop_codon:yes gene_type:complete
MTAVIIVAVAIMMSTVEHGNSLRGEVEHLEDALQDSRDAAIAAIVIMSVAFFIKIDLLYCRSDTHT